jgi:molecular chaperone GrpE (heat shock protein)
MTAEVQSFTEFMQQANEKERGTLRIEVEKLRRAEADWLQVLVRTLDHVFALHQGALRSGQPGLIEQLGHFQNACRDAARRVGLTPFSANEAEPFDPQRHQLVDGAAQPAPDAVVAQTIAAGYTFQGRLIRPALVSLRETPAAVSAPAPEAAPTPQSSLPLGPADTSPI